MQKFGIAEVAIVAGSKEVKMFSLVEVGSSLSNSIRCATLGGFAKNNDTVHVLMARHFAECSQNVFVIDENNRKHKIAKVLTTDGVRGNLDIAAAELEKAALRVCDTHFKESGGDYNTSCLYLFDTDDFHSYLKDLPVHIWGSSSSPGLGKIIIPDFHHINGMRLVLVEDMEGDGAAPIEERNRFAKEGDSGAVICSDDIDGEHVKVISMLMGCNNFKEAEENQSVKQTYLTFRMNSALQQLNKEHNKNFELC